MSKSKIIPVQLMKGSKVVPLTPDEYARVAQAAMVANAQTWLLTLIAAFLFLSTFAVNGQAMKALCVGTSLAVAIASRLSSGENVRADRIAKDHTDGSDSSRQSRLFEQTNIQQVPVESWFEALEETPDEQPEDYPHDLLCKPHDRDFVERFTLNRNSKIIVGAPGVGKTVLAKAWISSLFHFFPEALVLINYRKVASFCGLESVPGCTAQSKQGDLSGLFNQMAVLHAIHQARSDMSPNERKHQPPAVLYIADYAATWGNIAAIVGDRRHPHFNTARLFMERLAEIITVGRENNVQVVVDTQSFNLQALGNIDSNERGCLTTIGLGFESIDQWGQRSGNYEILQLLIRNAFMVSSDSDREQLANWLPLMRDWSQETRQPLAFTTLGGAELFFLADYRFFEDFTLPPDLLKRLQFSIADAFETHGADGVLFSGSDVFELGSAPVEPAELVQDGADDPEPLNQPQDGTVQDSVHGSALFTARQIPADEAISYIRLLRSEGWNQTQIIEQLWQVKKGGNKAYQQAKAEYDFLMQND